MKHDPLTTIAQGFTALMQGILNDKGVDSDVSYFDITPKIQQLLEAYAAQQNAELVAENKRLNELLTTRDAAITAWMKAVKEWEAENERLKQQVVTLRDAIARRLSQADDSGFCLLEVYHATQPPKEAT